MSEATEKLKKLPIIAEYQYKVDEIIALLSKEPDPIALIRRAEAAEQDWQLTKAENKKLREALLQHRQDLHQRSKRPCPTCRKSAEALGIKVPDECARSDWDKKALHTGGDQTTDGASSDKSEQ